MTYLMSKKWKYMLSLLFIGCEDDWIKLNGHCYRQGQSKATWAKEKVPVISFDHYFLIINFFTIIIFFFNNKTKKTNKHKNVVF